MFAPKIVKHAASCRLLLSVNRAHAPNFTGNGISSMRRFPSVFLNEADLVHSIQPVHSKITQMFIIEHSDGH